MAKYSTLPQFLEFKPERFRMQGDHARMQAAFRNWRAKRDEWDALIEKILAGDTSLVAQLQAMTPQLEALHKDFMRESQPFMHWRTS